MSAGDRVQVVDLARSFGSFEAVRGISLEIPAGETFGLLGPNGAGKTTTLSMLSTLLEPTRGDVRVFGASVVDDPAEVRRRVGLAPQQISLYPKLTAQENLEFFGRLHGRDGPALRERVDRLLELVGLAQRRGDLVHTFSGGMQRRLNLACSLIHEPRLLLLDEPTAGVDPQSREKLFEVIHEIASAGTTIIYTTHYIEEAERLCDRIGILDEGRIVAVGTLQELLEVVGMGEVIEIRSASIARDGRALEMLPEVTRIERDEDVVRVFVESAAHALTSIAGALREAGGDIESLEVYRVSLERVFMHLTGKALRD
jgi:ABC-2 type transport system ATP-binding protein